MSHGDPNQVVVTYSSLEEAAQSIQRQAKQLDQDLREIQGWVKGIASVWEGEAKTAYDGVQAKWDAKATHIHTILNEIANKVRTASSDYGSTDKKAAQSFQG
jgi:WXG100 family type VII secretion target